MPALDSRPCPSSRRSPRSGSGSRRTPCSRAVTARRGAAHPDVRAHPDRGPLDAARRRHRPRRGPAGRAAPRGPRGDRAARRAGPRRSTCTRTHFTGARSDGLVEDYHGIHLIFEATVLPRSEGVEPHVVEVDGSTDQAAWVPRDEALGLDLLGRRPLRPAPTLERARLDCRMAHARQPRDRLHLRRPAAEVRRRLLRRDRLRPLDVRRPPGARGHRPRRRGDRPPAADRRADRAASASRRCCSTGAHVEPTDASLVEAVDFARDGGPVGRVRRGRRRLGDRHRQGGQPAHAPTPAS